VVHHFLYKKEVKVEPTKPPVPDQQLPIPPSSPNDDSDTESFVEVELETDKKVETMVELDKDKKEETMVGLEKDKKLETTPTDSKKLYAYLSVTVFKRLPWNILPFILSIFIIVKSLQVASWTGEAAGALTTIIGPTNSSSTPISVFLIGGLSTISCSFLNNQPMTILFTQILNEEAFNVSANAKLGANFALIMGSNLGANITLVGALAGIMWVSILKNRGVSITYIEFALYGLTIMPLVIIIGCVILIIELQIF